ncbi:uncharacterized protein DUF1436 [Cricetibacter osteomyelitidis]|uniref:Uncharacterized protein DUF1436 n=1 Tax=Cricetibacter osteomyelitidis TaxID=1521931 RepID=A0A4R2SUR1_9PAST|nr:contact-dependent growth inhibition system immunity protein [Cricetibacter osteomyelitidis]TCP92064.1 uncharacterized protein DUF1436 [Cricetibacter osteomyelitidis]
MKDNKSILIRKNKDFLLVTSYLKGLIGMTNPEQNFEYTSLDISHDYLGEIIRKKLKESRVLEISEFQKIFHSEKMKSLTNSLEKEMKLKFGYKNKKEIYRDMNFLSIDINNGKLIVTPHHQDSLDGFTSVRDKNGNTVTFEYPITLSDEELGIAVMKAFEYCTSIYR